ncbi:unnamed protein product [Pleuronectes platessa]|uniref:Uncharacterized protein n=1 Tax=Pleuronectes platessa TaxID=8262 RepID=A0A9N7Y660_PLEPL|nr:unnamed protein product [Pleuronectes platessa]
MNEQHTFRQIPAGARSSQRLLHQGNMNQGGVSGVVLGSDVTHPPGGLIPLQTSLTCWPVCGSDEDEQQRLPPCRCSSTVFSRRYVFFFFLKLLSHFSVTGTESPPPVVEHVLKSGSPRHSLSPNTTRLKVTSHFSSSNGSAGGSWTEAALSGSRAEWAAP